MGGVLMKKVKKALLIMLCIMIICLIVWSIIHRYVIKAYILGEPVPEAPEWHKKCLGKVRSLCGQICCCCKRT